jgi:hypothetical protein
METNDQAPIPSSSVISETTPKQVIPGIYSKTMPNGEKREARVWLVLAEGEVNFIYTVYQPVESSHTLVTPNPPLVVSWDRSREIGDMSSQSTTPSATHKIHYYQWRGKSRFYLDYEIIQPEDSRYESIQSPLMQALHDAWDTIDNADESPFTTPTMDQNEPF